MGRSIGTDTRVCRLSTDENNGSIPINKSRIRVVWSAPPSAFPCRPNCPDVLAPSQVYPIGIPVLYATILWRNRDLLNPRISSDGNTTPFATGAGSRSGDENPASVFCTASKGRAKNLLSLEDMQELEEKVEARRENPELVPSMFLWKDFGETGKNRISTRKTGGLTPLPWHPMVSGTNCLEIVWGRFHDRERNQACGRISASTWKLLLWFLRKGFDEGFKGMRHLVI